jgi:PAS domain S-box-containing protein
VGVFGVSRDITERKRLEQEARKLAAVVESTDDAILTEGLDGRITGWNRGAEQMYGYTAEEVTGMHVSILVPEDRVSEVDELLERIMRGERIRHVDTIRLRKNGSPIHVSLAISPIRDGAGNVIGASSIDRDVTERTELQRQLEERARELELSNKELDQFASVASHDLQEPLRIVAGYVQLLARRYGDRLGAEADEFIGYALDGVARMQTLITDLLQYARVGIRGDDLLPTAVDDSLALALVNLRTSIEESGTTVTHDPMPTVVADGRQLAQLFQNLVGNAIKFQGEEPPRVHVSAELRDGEWRFSVQDNGIGIDPEYRDKIFGIFERLHPREEYPGTGVGLAICEKIVHRHGGRIWVESQPGAGAMFRFTIPAGEEDD